LVVLELEDFVRVLDASFATLAVVFAAMLTGFNLGKQAAQTA
jgi:hypothetical protein